ncbi:hypothetical protein ACHAW6_003344, partial [Cyclotella cf. meneghiniana]
NILQQCHFNRWSKICNSKHIKFLPIDAAKAARICKLDNILKEIVEEYNPQDIAIPDGWVYIRISKGMYGLPQAGSLGHDLLELRFNREEYNQSKIVPGLWKHKDQPIMFTLVVDNFGIKDMTNKDLNQLIETL